MSFSFTDDLGANRFNAYTGSSDESCKAVGTDRLANDGDACTRNGALWCETDWAISLTGLDYLFAVDPPASRSSRPTPKAHDVRREPPIGS